jgi:hypothetical protein
LIHHTRRIVGPLGIYSVTKWKRRARSALILTL